MKTKRLFENFGRTLMRQGNGCRHYANENFTHGIRKRYDDGSDMDENFTHGIRKRYDDGSDMDECSVSRRRKHRR